MNIFNWLKNGSNKFALATTAEQIPPYQEGFEQALRFTKSLGYDTTSLSLSDSNTNLLSAPEKLNDLVDRVFQAARIEDRTQAGGQCLKWCHFLQPFFQQQLGKRVMLTIGQLWASRDCVYGPTFEDVRRWKQSGLQMTDFEGAEGINLHAWLTVESGEIIEPTLLSTLARFGPESYKKYAGATVCGRDPNMLNAHRYVPLTVGNNIVEDIAERSAMPLLASSLGELELTHVIVVS